MPTSIVSKTDERPAALRSLSRVMYIARLQLFPPVCTFKAIKVFVGTVSPSSVMQLSCITTTLAVVGSREMEIVAGGCLKL